MKKIKLISLVLLSITVGISCVTTTEIGLNRNFHKGNFIVGKTTKSEVVDFLGLPQKMEKMKNGMVRFVYHGEAVLTSVITGSGPSSPSLLAASSNESDVSRGATYTFNGKGILLKKVEPKSRTEEN